MATTSGAASEELSFLTKLKKQFYDDTQRPSKFIIKPKPSIENINFITPPVDSHVYPVFNNTLTQLNSTFKTFCKRFCSKFYIPEDVSLCISLLFYNLHLYRRHEIGVPQSRKFVDEIIGYYSARAHNENSISPSFYFLHAFNAINHGTSSMLVNPETLKNVGARVSPSLLRYSLFELGDEYLHYLIRYLDKTEASPSLLLDAPPDLVPLTECHARFLATRIKRLGILPRDGIMSNALYRFYFNIIEGCINNLRPISFDPDMVYSECVYELKHFVRQGKITIKTEQKRNLLIEGKDEAAATTKKRCVVGSEGRKITIVQVDSSSLVLLDPNNNERALANLLKRLETPSGYCSFINVKDAPGTCGAAETLVRYFEPLLDKDQYLLDDCMSTEGFNTAIRRLEKSKGVEENFIFAIKRARHKIEPVHTCREIHLEGTLQPAVELSLGKNFPLETTVESILNKPKIDDFTVPGFTVLARYFIAFRTREKTATISDGEERELKALKDLVDLIPAFSLKRNDSDNSGGIVACLLNPFKGYKYEYPETNVDAVRAYVLEKLCTYFREKGHTRSFCVKNLFDKVPSQTYLLNAIKYLGNHMFAPNSFITVVDAMCYVENGADTLVWIIKNCFKKNENSKKAVFMRIIRNTVGQSLPLESGISPLPSITLETLVRTFPQMCYMGDKDFGVLRESIERQSRVFCWILDLPNVRATINCRYRHYGNTPAICLGHLMVNTMSCIDFVFTFLRNGADPTVTTDEGENLMHFMARAFNDFTDKQDRIGDYNLEMGRLKDNSKRLFSTRRHYDGATPIMVAVAYRNVYALEFFIKNFFVNDHEWFNTAFGRSDCLRTIDVMLLSGIMFPSLFQQGGAVAVENQPSVRLLAKAALENKLYCNGDSPVPLNRVGLTFDGNAYKGIQNIGQTICYIQCPCQIAASTKLFNIQRLEHRNDIWCILNFTNNISVQQITSRQLDCTMWNNFFKKEYAELWLAIVNNDRGTLENIEKAVKRKRGNLMYHDGTCAICYDELREDDRDLYFIEKCNHVYHKLCIKEWEKIQKRCPICKRVYETSIPREDIILEG